jgi:hypothetical protein
MGGVRRRVRRVRWNIVRDWIGDDTEASTMSARVISPHDVFCEALHILVSTMFSLSI